MKHSTSKPLVTLLQATPNSKLTFPNPFSAPTSLKQGDTEVLNICCSDFNSLLFLTPPKIRANQDVTTPSPIITEQLNDIALNKAIPKDLMASLEQDFDEPSTPLKDITNLMHDDSLSKRKSTKSFKFPDGGWVCLACQNYNFYGRVKCNRCGKAKTKDDPVGKPKHLLRKENEENNQPQKKVAKERTGNWLCLSCQNINFSFRQHCNRCKIDKKTIQDQIIDYQKTYSYLPIQYEYQGYSSIVQKTHIVFPSSM